MSRTEANLLPVGLYDSLPPAAETESRALHALLRTFGDFGYAQVGAPLLEFEETLLSGKGQGLSPHSFRIMDPISRRMLALRADMTMQIARIASDRLRGEPRPLRLCYAGQTLRVQSESLDPRRQFRQVGIELIAERQLASGADAEVIGVALAALRQAGLERVTLDLNAPGLVRALLAPLHMEAQAQQALETQLAQKDASALGTLPPETARTLTALIEASGSAARALPALRAITLQNPVAAQRNALCDLVGILQAQWPDLRISLDAVEARGFEYHHGISFTFFSTESTAELGRGGRYMLDETSEATGATLYLDALHPLLSPPMARRLLLVCGNIQPEALAELQTQGYQTLLAAPGINEKTEARARAREERCAAFWLGGSIIEAKE